VIHGQRCLGLGGGDQIETAAVYMLHGFISGLCLFCLFGDNSQRTYPSRTQTGENSQVPSWHGRTRVAPQSDEPATTTTCRDPRVQAPAPARDESGAVKPVLPAGAGLDMSMHAGLVHQIVNGIALITGAPGPGQCFVGRTHMHACWTPSRSCSLSARFLGLSVLLSRINFFF
jgi:hypothetical protein